MGLFQTIAEEVLGFYKLLLDSLPQFAGVFINLFLLVLFIVLFSIFLWKFHEFIAKKNIIKLNLNQYNIYEHPAMMKLVAGFFYFIEYIVVLPFLIFFWYSVFVIFMILLTSSLEINSLLFISAAIVASIRMASYYGKDFAENLSSLLPFTFLAIALFDPEIISIERIIEHISKIPIFGNEILLYLLFIIGLEVVLRFFDFIFSLFGVEEEVEE